MRNNKMNKINLSVKEEACVFHSFEIHFCKGLAEPRLIAAAIF